MFCIEVLDMRLVCCWRCIVLDIGFILMDMKLVQVYYLIRLILCVGVFEILMIDGVEFDSDSGLLFLVLFGLFLFFMGEFSD